jgi:hypothetical protein
MQLNSLSRILSRTVHEPLLHFLAIGAVLFLLFAALNDAPPAAQSDAIIITQQKVDQLAAGFEAVWRRPPTADETQGLVDNFIREEILVREAVALGLDRDDTVIRRRLRQKMEFLTDSAAAMIEATDEELRAHYAASIERFKAPVKVGFQQVFLGETATEADVDTAKAALLAGSDPGDVGARTLLPLDVPVSVSTAIDGTFGKGFFEQIAGLDPGIWIGPIRSGFGIHLVRVTKRIDAREPPLETIREAVLRDWSRKRAEEIGEKQYERLLSRYQVTYRDRFAATRQKR